MATQFDILLPLTKPIIPLGMLVATGQVWSGIITSLGSSHVLRNYLPKMNYETHHLVCFLFGFFHTILGVSAQSIEGQANRNEQQQNNVKLTWEWGMKDMVSILNMVTIG